MKVSLHLLSSRYHPQRLDPRTIQTGRRIAQQTFSPCRLVLIETFFTHNVKSADDNVACETLRDFLRRDSNGKTMRTRPRQLGINTL